MGYPTTTLTGIYFGPDIDAQSLEVVCLIASSVVVGLTPNEYKMSKKAKRKYRICIVCNALGTSDLYEFLWKEVEGFWFDDRTLKRLEIREIVSANLAILG